MALRARHPQEQTITIAQQEQSLAIEPVTPTRAGFTFIGWLSDKVDTVVFDFASTPINSDITLYAGWQSDYVFAFKGREYPAIVDGDTFLVNIGKTYTQINDQKVTLLRVPRGVTTKPAAGSEIQLTKSWASFEADENGQKTDYKLELFLDPTTRAELKAITDAAIATEGNKVDLNFIKTHRYQNPSN